MMSKRVAGVLLLLVLSVAHAADTASAELDAVREQLVALDIEKAIAALDGILERPGLSEAERVDALDLRAQAHAASDDLAGAEKDYRAILELRAGYVPNSEVTSKKAMDRFVKLRATMVGTVQLDVDPKDASITMDDRPVAVDAQGSFPAIAGERRLKFTRNGFDPLDDVVHAVAGADTILKIRMVPNARGLVVRTDVPGVAVTLDGASRGVTARPAADGVAADAPFELEVQNVPIGEHELSLSKSCFASENVPAIVSVDLADRSPKRLPLVTMRPARTRVTAAGAQYPGELRIDGERVASLPLTSFSMCPGVRSLEVAAAGRVVWSGTITTEESDVTLDFTPRPNVVLVGSAWPKSWDDVLSVWSRKDRIDAPAGVDLFSREGWESIPLPPGTDVALGVVSHAGVGGGDRTVLYSPALREVEDRAAPPTLASPAWVATTIGIVPVDGPAGAVIVGSVSPQGPAGKAGLLAGDRVLSIGGRSVASAAAARGVITGLGNKVPVALEVASPALPPRKIECLPETVLSIRDDGGSRAVRAAWASVDAAAGGADGPLALFQLAMLLESAGQDAAALAAWRGVRAAGSGALSARAWYAEGTGLQAAGKRPEAIEAFKRAKTEGLAIGDPTLVAAADDRLADLGVASR
jgi:hypothetical protein